MGKEYRLDVIPRVGSLDAACSDVFASTSWTRIPTSFVDVPDGIGVQSGNVPANPDWPHVADLCVEDDGRIYVVCHGGDGGQFKKALISHLESNGHTVVVDDDI